MNNKLKNKLVNIPHSYGVYLWKDINNNIIYVGKAKNLFNRTHQYFNEKENKKTIKLVENINDIDYIVTNNENESLILESQLIDKYKPKYNILLRYNNNYPYILLTQEKNPRLVYTRNKDLKGKYYGPFAISTFKKFDIYKMLNQIFLLRKCNPLKKAKCLYYDIGQCVGPCINKISEEKYEEIKKEIDNFFKGNNSELLKKLKEKELNFSKNNDYENALKTNELINSILQLKKHDNQNNFNFKNKNINVINWYIEDQYISIALFSYENSKLFSRYQEIFYLNNEIEETIEDFIIQYYSKLENKPNICYIENNIDLSIGEFLSIKFIKPKNKKILSMIKENAREFYKLNILKHKGKENRTLGAFNEFKKILNIKNLNIINMFDMSNFYGQDKIGAMITLKDGEFSKNLYRKFIIKDKKSKSDGEYMYECIYRQYAKKENQNVQLIIVDGGIIQVNAAKKALGELNLNIPVIGLTKNQDHKLEYITIDKNKNININKKTNLYLFLFNMQEEVHRYAITFFKKKNTLIKQ